VLGLQLFFELGLSYVIVQFASHEKVRLEWAGDGTLQGDPATKVRLAGLLRKATAWYGVAACLAMLALLPIGLHFFSHQSFEGNQVSWKLPWIASVFLCGASLVTVPAFAILEGCGLIVQVAKLRTVLAILGGILLWTVLSLEAGLFANAICSAFTLCGGVCWLWRVHRRCLLDLFAFRGVGLPAIDWRKEVWPFQWKMALSGISGYLVFSLYNPILFKVEGPVTAGQMGMSMNLMLAISAVAGAWLTAKTVPFGTMVAQARFADLDRLFFPAFWQSLCLVCLGGLTCWLGALYLTAMHHPFAERLLSPTELALLIGSVVVTHIAGAQALYLRAHKEEPFLIISLSLACLIPPSIYFFGRWYGATGMLSVSLCLNLMIGFGGGTLIFLQKRRLWHS
jgi:hypothetical protein